MVSWLNRHQNVSMLSFCSLSPDVSCQTEYELNEPNGWIDLYSAPKFSASGRQFLMVLPTAQGDAGNFKHLVLYDRDHKTIRALTSGRWEVTDVLAWNEAIYGNCCGQTGHPAHVQREHGAVWRGRRRHSDVRDLRHVERRSERVHLQQRRVQPRFRPLRPRMRRSQRPALRHQRHSGRWSLLSCQCLRQCHRI